MNKGGGPKPTTQVTIQPIKVPLALCGGVLSVTDFFGLEYFVLRAEVVVKDNLAVTGFGAWIA